MGMSENSENKWLIRTRSMQILGPVRLSKVVELIEKGSLREEDELSSANGFWFCLKERDLVQRYIYNGEDQPFNPISEAPSVLTKTVTKAIERREESIQPTAEDLEYPTIDIMPNAVDEIPDEEDVEIDDEDEDLGDMTMVLNEELIEKSRELEPIEIQAPIEKILEQHQEQLELEDDEDEIKIRKPKGKKHRPNPTIKKNDRYLFVLLFLVCAVVIGIIYYYRTVLNKPLPGFESSWLMPKAYAQGMLLSGANKKKIGSI